MFFVFAVFFALYFIVTDSFASWVEKSSSYFAPALVPCNTDLPVPLTSTNFNDLEVSSNTSGVCLSLLGCYLSDAENLIDGDETNYASAVTLVGVGATHTLRVTDNTTNEFYVGGSYAGFLIENSSALQANVLSATAFGWSFAGIKFWYFPRCNQ